MALACPTGGRWGERYLAVGPWKMRAWWPGLGWGDLGSPTVDQDSTFPISQKGTGATERKRWGQEKEDLQDSIPGTMGTRRQNPPTLGLEQEGAGVVRDGAGQSGGEGSVPSGSVLQDWACEGLAPVPGKGFWAWPAGLPLPAGGEAGWQCQEGE